MSARTARRTASVATMTLLLLGLAATRAASVAADCQGPLPIFRDFAPSARTVVIADVIATEPGGPWDAQIDGYSSRLTLRVRHVLHGEAAATMQLVDVATGTCVGDGLVGRVGDRLAIALDASLFGPTYHPNAEAWIRGTPPASWYWLETITQAQAFRVMGLRVPDTAAALPGSPPSGWLPLAAGLVASLALVTFSRVGRLSRSCRCGVMLP